MSTIALHELRRQLMQSFVPLLMAIVLALVAYQFLLAVQGYLQLAPRLASMPDAPGVTDVVIVPLLGNMSMLLLAVIPLLTMRLLAGEQRAQTLVLLLAAGVGNTRIVLGKYLAALSIVWLLLALLLLMPLALLAGSPIDLGRLASGALGLALYSGALVAIGLLCSAATASPALAATASLAISALLMVVDSGARLEGIDHAGINYLAIPTHLQPFLQGVIASVDVVYFLLLAGVALALATWRLERLREVAS